MHTEFDHLFCCNVGGSYAAVCVPLRAGYTVHPLKERGGRGTLAAHRCRPTGVQMENTRYSPSNTTAQNRKDDYTTAARWHFGRTRPGPLEARVHVMARAILTTPTELYCSSCLQHLVARLLPG